MGFQRATATKHLHPVGKIPGLQVGRGSFSSHGNQGRSASTAQAAPAPTPSQGGLAHQDSPKTDWAARTRTGLEELCRRAPVTGTGRQMCSAGRSCTPSPGPQLELSCWGARLHLIHMATCKLQGLAPNPCPSLLFWAPWGIPQHHWPPQMAPVLEGHFQGTAPQEIHSQETLGPWHTHILGLQVKAFQTVSAPQGEALWSPRACLVCGVAAPVGPAKCQLWSSLLGRPTAHPARKSDTREPRATALPLRSVCVLCARPPPRNQCRDVLVDAPLKDTTTRPQPHRLLRTRTDYGEAWARGPWHLGQVLHPRVVCSSVRRTSGRGCPRPHP